MVLSSQHSARRMSVLTVVVGVVVVDVVVVASEWLDGRSSLAQGVNKDGEAKFTAYHIMCNCCKACRSNRLVGGVAGAVAAS